MIKQYEFFGGPFDGKKEFLDNIGDGVKFVEFPEVNKTGTAFDIHRYNVEENGILRFIRTKLNAIQPRF